MTGVWAPLTGFPRLGGGKNNLPAKAESIDLIPGLGRSSRVEGNGNPLQYSCREDATEHERVSKEWRKNTMLILTNHWI